MIDPGFTAKLRDPAYFSLHLQAARSIRHVGQLEWYDSDFLRRFEVARHYLGIVCPDSLETFLGGFAPIKPKDDFSPIKIDDVFDDATRKEIIRVAREVQPEDDKYQDYENSEFGRHVIWDNDFFRELQEQVRPLLSEVLGRPLQSTYNFLSIYGGSGKCDPHIDHPHSMFTFDYCIEQSEEWPIYFSKVVDWSSAGSERRFDAARIKHDPSLQFVAHRLRPNQALLFCGSSQWHYRDPITSGGFCKLLFFHYIPSGYGDLVTPARWASHFRIPELEPLCDLFCQNLVDGFAPKGV